MSDRTFSNHQSQAREGARPQHSRTRPRDCRRGHRMRRREFIAVLGGASAWPLAGRAQQPERMRRIGVLMLWSENDPFSQKTQAAFEQVLGHLGWAAGKNIRID